jgi:hypothetical protein
MDQARPLRRVVIREEYISLTGDHVSAVLLSQIEYWTVRTRDFDHFLAEEKSRAKMEGKSTGVSFLHGWIYKTAEDLSAETMMGLSANTTRARLRRLAERGWIGERNNLATLGIGPSNTGSTPERWLPVWSTWAITWRAGPSSLKL